jgi:hypothetical protein
MPSQKWLRKTEDLVAVDDIFNEFPRHDIRLSYHSSRTQFDWPFGKPRWLYPQRSLHALAQLHQDLVEGVDSNKPQTRIFDIENDVNRNRHDERKAKHM